MNFLIYSLTDVRRPVASPEALHNLADLWDAVRRSALACAQESRMAIDDVLASNRGKAVAAFEARVTSSTSSMQQLERLADAALATRDAHIEASATVRSTQTAMDAVANGAARDLVLSVSILVPWLRYRHIQQVISTARVQLITLLVAANVSVTASYARVSLPNLMSLSEAQTRGSVPDDVAALWATLSDEDRRRLLVAMAEEAMEGMDVTDRPKITFYSVSNPAPPDVMPPPPGTDWGGFNGVTRGDEVWLNNDFLAPNPTLMSTALHEVQHVTQAHLRAEYDQLVSADPDLVQDVRAGRQPDPFLSQGSTIDEVERFKAPYQSTQVPEEAPFYRHQSVEVDARRAGTEYLDLLTLEKAEELLR